jgi:hypothetical protein
MTDATEKGNSPPKRRIGSIFLWILAAAIVCTFYESIVLLVIGMLPTGIALALDRSRHKDQARSVGYLNFAGCLPWVVDFWMSGGNLERVFEIVGDPLVLAVMYTAAATGWALCFIIRPFVATYLAVAVDYREGQVKKRQNELAAEWGDEVRDGNAETVAENAD